MAVWDRARNGVHLGARGSLGNMLRRSFGAPSFAGFWRHWNPVRGYWLARLAFRPARRWVPREAAVVWTFAVSGFAHDLVIIGVRRSFVLIFTPWFLLVGAGVIAGARAGMDLSRLPWLARAVVHVGFIGACFLVVRVFVR
jgi:hypothetical protein